MRKILLLLIMNFLFSPSMSVFAQEGIGFFNYHYDDTTGKLTLEVPKDRGEFIYVNYLSSGLGSNDIGLDRGQIGDTRLVHFKKYGNNLLLIQNNQSYRAITDNKLEAKSVEEAFAKSILGTFEIKETKNDLYIIDITTFVVRDAHHVAKRLKDQKQGNYTFDKKKSVVEPSRCKSFPQNTEFEAIVSFNGDAKGSFLKSVTASDENISLAIHHSFIELPDEGYSPRKFHPYCGYFPMVYKDYAVPIAENMDQRFIYRHRLEKKNPDAEMSEAIEPIIYYIDAGCPDPVKSALMDGAAWWNEAFEAAGFINGFQIKELPEGADPLDVRYNMIQWVHRSTRGWSYGASVSDPRTGEIIKGHVSLGSLRVRQDYLIMQALLSPFGPGEGGMQQDIMEQVALARLRQLAAHEVGHTIGLAHNFSSSINDRASVMDYPHPKLSIKENTLDYADAYDTKIGAWDKRAIVYGYSQISQEMDESEVLEKILKETSEMSLKYISDSDARPVGGAHPEAHLWDNGESAIDALYNINQVREFGLNRLGDATLKKGTPYSELEKLLVPVYMSHRYQVEAVSKLIGGVHYNYAVKEGPERLILGQVSQNMQEKAFRALLSTLEADFLNPGEVLKRITPPAMGYERTRETFKGKMGPVFDPFAAAESSAKLSLDLLMHPHRLNRVHYNFMNLSKYLSKIKKACKGNDQNYWNTNIAIQNHTLFIHKLLELANSQELNSMAKMHVIDCLKQEHLSTNSYTKMLVDQYFAGQFDPTKSRKVKLPPGSPIGCGHFH